MRTKKNNRYIVREVCKDKFCVISPRETLFISPGLADEYAFRRADFLGDNWQVYVYRCRLVEGSPIFRSKK